MTIQMLGEFRAQDSGVIVVSIKIVCFKVRNIHFYAKTTVCVYFSNKITQNARIFAQIFTTLPFYLFLSTNTPF